MVVISPALADNVLQWLGVLEAVAAGTQACVYDRAGVGFPVKSMCRSPGHYFSRTETALDWTAVEPERTLSRFGEGLRDGPGRAAGVISVCSGRSALGDDAAALAGQVEVGDVQAEDLLGAGGGLV